MADTMLVPYPTDLSEAVKIMLRRVRGETVPLSTGIHAAYQVAGVCLNNIYPDVEASQLAAFGAAKPTTRAGRKAKVGATGAEEATEQPVEDGVFTEECCPEACEEDSAHCQEVLEKSLAVRGDVGGIDQELLQQLLSVAVGLLMKWLSKKNVG